MKYLMPAAVFMLMVSIGMSLDLRALVANWRRLDASAWVRLLLITFLVPPALALLLARLFGLSLAETAGLFLVGAVPGAPLLTRKLAQKGYDMQLAASYQVWGALLTPLVVPLVVAGAGKLYGRDIWVPPAALLLQIARQQFLPLLAGLALVAVAPAFSRKVQGTLNRLGNAILTIALIALLVKMGPALTDVNPWVPVAALLLAAGALSVVHLLGRRRPEVIETLSISNANRHVGLAILLCGQYLHARAAIPAVACYALAAAVVIGLYARFVARGPDGP